MARIHKFTPCVYTLFSQDVASYKSTCKSTKQQAYTNSLLCVDLYKVSRSYYSESIHTDYSFDCT